jgi:hypothetical protein
MTTNKGIDYGNGGTNMNFATQIRFGVIPIHALHEFIYDELEADYGSPCCPDCGHEDLIKDHDPKYAFWCSNCDSLLNEEDTYRDDPVSQYIIKDGIKAFLNNDGVDFFVEDSPYYTYAAFCSPCAPGACYLLSPLAQEHRSNNNKCYCFGHDYFDKEIAPYPVYSVATNELVLPSKPQF